MGSHILLFGATGQCGSIFAQRALFADHRVTLYVRSPQKLSKELSSHPKATVVVGQLNDKEKLVEALKYGADSCVLLIGGDPWTSGTVGAFSSLANRRHERCLTWQTMMTAHT